MPHAPGVELSGIQHVTAVVLQDIEADPRLGQARVFPDFQLRFGDGRMRPPGEGEDFMARGIFPVGLNGRSLGKLAVTALAPGQGTGGTETFGNDGLARPLLLSGTPGTIPVSREGVYAEVHLPIATLLPVATAETDGTHQAMRVYRLFNHLHLLGVDESTSEVISTGTVGQSSVSLQRILEGMNSVTPHPHLTLTTGNNRHGQRFGEHTALYNATEAIQLSGTLTIPDNTPENMGFLKRAPVRQPYGIR